MLDDLLKLVDLPIEKLALIGMGVLEESQLRLLDALQFIPLVGQLHISDAFSLEDFVLEILALLLEQINGVLVVVFNFEVLGENLLNFSIFGGNHLL